MRKDLQCWQNLPAITGLVIKTIIFAFLVIFFISCDKESDSFRNERRVPGKVSFLDVMNARALLIGGEQSSLKSDEYSVAPGSSLFKITEDGVIQEIRYWQIDTIYIETEEGIEIEIDSIELTTVVYPVHIFNADENHLIVCFDEEQEGDPYHPYMYDYLVRKSDGAVFELPPGFRPETRWTHYNQMFRNETSAVVIQHDQAGYIYYIGKGDIQKLSTQNPENITLQALTTGGHTGEGVMNYRVNGAGHILFNSGGISSAGSTRIRFNNGGLAYPEKNLPPYWLGFDNNFYFSYTPDWEPGIPIRPVIEKLTLENGEASYNQVGIIDHEGAENTHVSGSFIFKIRNLNKIVVMDLADHMEREGKVVAEVYNTEQQVKAFSMEELGITTVNIAISSDNYYYISGLDENQPVVLRVDASVFPHRAEHLLPRGSHDIYKMVVTSDDYVAFQGLRMSDGNIIIGEVSPGGVVTEMEDIGTEVIQLTQIN
jgi:hypothetical protein